MANPDPEVTPEEVAEIRSDAIVATGRSDYPNQINNVLGFPYIFRGALDVRASTINEEMKAAAARAIAELAREDVPDEVAAAYSGERPKYGPQYIIPTPFDPRLITYVPPAVAQAAMDTGVARKPIIDMSGYRDELAARLDPAQDTLQLIFDRLRAKPQRTVFAEGEEETVIRAALAYLNSGYGTPILIGREEGIRNTMKEAGLQAPEGLEIHNAAFSRENKRYSDFLYKRLQRKGFLMRDCQRMVNNDRNVFGACMVAHNDADAMVTGTTRSYAGSLENILHVIDKEPGKIIFGLSMIVAKGRTVLVSDTSINEIPTADQLADIAEQSAEAARGLGQENPRVALLSFANFGNPMAETSGRIRETVEILDQRDLDFEYDGEMSADVALNSDLMKLYPFSRLTEPANVLVMPALHSANIASKMMQELGGSTVIGPLIVGLEKSIQIVPLGATVSDVVNMAAMAAYDAMR